MDKQQAMSQSTEQSECPSTHVMLNGIESDSAAVNNIVFILDGVLHRRLDHRVELVPVLPGPNTGGHFSHEDHEQTAEELKRVDEIMSTTLIRADQ